MARLIWLRPCICWIKKTRASIRSCRTWQRLPSCQPPGAHWQEKGPVDYWNWNTDTRTTAIVLNTFVQIDPNNPITANAVRWLMAARSGKSWYSTQETTWALIALTNWLTASKEFQTNYSYAVGLNGNSIERGVANKDNLTQSVSLQIQLKDLLKDTANYLVFTRGNGTGNLYYTAYLSTNLAVASLPPLDQGVSPRASISH